MLVARVMGYARRPLPQRHGQKGVEAIADPDGGLLNFHNKNGHIVESITGNDDDDSAD